MRRRVGVLGVGGIGLLHAQIIAEDPACDFVAVCDVNENITGELVSRYGCASYMDWTTFFNSVDIAVIALPHHLHAAAVEAAAVVGCDVLVEKPLAVSSDDCRRIAGIEKDSGIRVMVGHPMRFSAAFMAAGQVIRSREMGDVRLARTQLVVPWGSARPAWQTNAATGGALLMWGSHAIDRICWLTSGRVASVSGHIGHLFHPSSGAEDWVAARLTMDTSAEATAFLLGYEKGLSNVDTEVYLDGGMITVSSRGVISITSTDGGTDQRTFDDSWPESALRRQWRSFMRALDENVAFEVTLDEAAHIVSVLEGVRTSSHLGGVEQHIGESV